MNDITEDALIEIIKKSASCKDIMSFAQTNKSNNSLVKSNIKNILRNYIDSLPSNDKNYWIAKVMDVVNDPLSENDVVYRKFVNACTDTRILPDEFKRVDSPLRLERYRTTHISKLIYGADPNTREAINAQRRAWVIEKMRGKPGTNNEGIPLNFVNDRDYIKETYFNDDPVALTVLDMMPKIAFSTHQEYRAYDILNDIFERIYRYTTYHVIYPRMPLYLPGIDYTKDDFNGWYEKRAYESNNDNTDKFVVDDNNVLQLKQVGGKKSNKSKKSRKSKKSIKSRKSKKSGKSKKSKKY